MRARQSDRLEASAVLRRLISTVEKGEIEADTPIARRLLRRLEGAAIGLAATDRTSVGADVPRKGQIAAGDGRTLTAIEPLR